MQAIVFSEQFIENIFLNLHANHVLELQCVRRQTFTEIILKDNHLLSSQLASVFLHEANLLTVFQLIQRCLSKEILSLRLHPHVVIASRSLIGGHD